MVLALLLLRPGLVRAEGEAEVLAYLLSVNRLYEDLEYERALAQLQRARSLARTVEENVTLSLYEGVILADMNRWEESAAAFKEALFLRPEARLPVQVSPKVERHFDSVRQKVLEELKASVANPVEEPPVTPSAPPESLPQRGEPSSPVVTETSRPDLLRPQVLIPAIGSGVLLVSGGTLWALSRGELSRLRKNDERLATREDVHASASRGRTYQTLGLGLVGAGLVGLGVTTALSLRGPSDEVSLRLGTDGTSAFVQGRWP